MEYAEKAQKMRLRWSRPHVLQGEICRQRGNDEEALEHYLQASVNGDRDLEFIRLLLQMLYERQRYQEAEQVIHRLDSNQTAVTADIAKEEAKFFMTWGDFDRALELANAAYNPASERLPRARLARPCAEAPGPQGPTRRPSRQAAGDCPEGRGIAPHAHAESPPMRRTAAWSWSNCWWPPTRRKRPTIAADDAQEMIPLEVAPLAMGYIYEALGDETAKAGQSYEKALKAMPDQPLAIRVLADFYVRNGNFQRAAPLIERLLSGEVPASENDLRQRPPPEGRDLGSVLIRAIPNSRRRPSSSIATWPRRWPSPRTSASRSASSWPIPARPAAPRSRIGGKPGRDRRSGARPRRSLPIGPPVSGPRRLGSLPGADGKARQRQPDAIRCYLAAYVRMLLERDQLDDAEHVLDRLERRFPIRRQTVALRAEWLYRKNEWGKVPDFLEAYVNQGKRRPRIGSTASSSPPGCSRIWASRLTAPGLKDVARNYFEKARQWYEAYVGKRPGSEMLLAGFDARHGKVEEAIEQIERYGEKSPPEEVFEVVGAIVSRPATAQQLKTLEAILVALLDKTHRPTPLLVAWAEVQSARNRPQAAEEIYREILRKDPNDDMACNNLAMVLALQGTKLNEALALIDKTIQRAGPLGPFLDTRAVVSIARGQPQQALQDLELALAEKATPLRLFHRAWAYQEGGNPDKAKESLQLARNARLEDAMLAEPELEIRKKIAPGNN